MNLRLWAKAEYAGACRTPFRADEIGRSWYSAPPLQCFPPHSNQDTFRVRDFQDASRVRPISPGLRRQISRIRWRADMVPPQLSVQVENPCLQHLSPENKTCRRQQPGVLAINHGSLSLYGFFAGDFGGAVRCLEE